MTEQQDQTTQAYTHTPQGSGQGPVQSPGPRPFAGVPVGDYIRDGVAALLLLISLALPWSLTSDATDRIDVVLITLLSLFSLSVHYLGRVGSLGAGFTPAVGALVRALANLPYVVLVLVYLVDDAVGPAAEAVGLGAAAAVGLAGALLAAQPRRAELAAAPRAADAWRWVLTGLGVLVGLLIIASVVLFAIDLGSTVDAIGVTWVVQALVATAVTAVLVVWPLIGTLRGDGGWRLVLLGLGGAATFLYVLTATTDGMDASVESVHFLSAGLILWPALAATAAAPSIRDQMRPQDPVALWTGASTRLLAVTILAGALHVVVIVLALVDDLDRGPRIALLVVMVLYVIAAVVARSMIANDQANARYVAYGVAAALFVLGIIAVSVTAKHSSVSIQDVLFDFAVPIALATTTTVAVLMATRQQRGTAPVELRPTPAAPIPSALADPVAAPPPSAPAAAPVALPAPVAPVATAPAPDSVEIQQAMDPRTDPAVLADLAARVPETWVHLARNPATYPDLLTWLGDLGDPAVTAALQERIPPKA